ncbi:unnamed protein product [Paramecium octaurelia]|uniref:Uncharacterized protein n=1 Tax=Paramecium octaurelia TaxID=43137 RepID=A0A8S1VT08_PAROT|nr:unnamed protein product [Paramecium octaurelia]CAD8178912.1 unnamed protein product [Paramecium octaurelia]
MLDQQISNIKLNQQIELLIFWCSHLQFSQNIIQQQQNFRYKRICTSFFAAACLFLTQRNQLKLFQNDFGELEEKFSFEEVGGDKELLGKIKQQNKGKLIKDIKEIHNQQNKQGQYHIKEEFINQQLQFQYYYDNQNY